MSHAWQSWKQAQQGHQLLEGRTGMLRVARREQWAWQAQQQQQQEVPVASCQARGGEWLGRSLTWERLRRPRKRAPLFNTYRSSTYCQVGSEMAGSVYGTPERIDAASSANHICERGAAPMMCCSTRPKVAGPQVSTYARTARGGPRSYTPWEMLLYWSRFRTCCGGTEVAL